MFRFVFVLLALSLFSNLANADPRLLGTWRSDHQRTMNFAKDRAKLQDKTLLFLSQIMGHLTLTVGEGTIVNAMPDLTVETAEGVRSRFNGYLETTSYKLLGSTETEVAIATTELFTGRAVIVVFHFDAVDSMWVYIGGATFPDANYREYFSRQK